MPLLCDDIVHTTPYSLLFNFSSQLSINALGMLPNDSPPSIIPYVLTQIQNHVLTNVCFNDIAYTKRIIKHNFTSIPLELQLTASH